MECDVYSIVYNILMIVCNCYRNCTCRLVLNARLVENVLWILRNLSDAATKQVRRMFVNTIVRLMM